MGRYAENTEFEGEFPAHIGLPNGRSAGQFILPQAPTAHATGEAPALLPVTRE